jgi:hypothetical protein
LGEESTLSRILSLLPIVVIALIGLAVVVFYSTITSTPNDLPPLATRSAQPTPTATATPTARKTGSGTALPVSPHTPTPTVLPGGSAFALTPVATAIGWVANDAPAANHLGDNNIHSGIYSGTTYYGAIAFDLGRIPQGTQIQYATLELVGLSGDKVGSGGTWHAAMLDPAIDLKWPNVNFDMIRDAPADWRIGPALTAGMLGPGKTNLFDFDESQLRALEQHLVTGRVVFRMEGPARGADNLFTWDAGYQPNGVGYKPILRIGLGPLANSPTPTYVLVTPTATPLNGATATSFAATATYVATAIGTATPLPPNWVTPVVIVPTLDADVFAAATRSAVLTAQALRGGGTSTPTPANWVLAILITATPTPGNQATRDANSAIATAVAQTTGTPTAFPFNVVVITPSPTATATPTAVRFAETITPTPSATATATALPTGLTGKIVFLSDRNGIGTEVPYIMNPDGSDVNRLSSVWIHQFADRLDKLALAGTLRVAVLNGETKNQTGTKIVLYRDQSTQPFTIFDAPAINYDPAFAADGYHIVFVSTLNGHDELYVTNRDANNVQQITNSTWEWNKHPTWSPDGTRIAWWSNRETGRRQIWIMNADGTSQVNVSNNQFNDFDPVWIK